MQHTIEPVRILATLWKPLLPTAIRLKAASIAFHHGIVPPSLEAPIDDERLRFNTTQKYSINHIRKNKQDAESRIEANYLRRLSASNGRTPLFTTLAVKPRLQPRSRTTRR